MGEIWLLRENLSSDDKARQDSAEAIYFQDHL